MITVKYAIMKKKATWNQYFHPGVYFHDNEHYFSEKELDAIVARYDILKLHPDAWIKKIVLEEIVVQFNQIDNLMETVRNM